MNSWRTTICGICGIVGGVIMASDFGPLATKIAACMVTAANSIGLMFARDERTAKRQAEQMEAKIEESEARISDHDTEIVSIQTKDKSKTKGQRIHS